MIMTAKMGLDNDGNLILVGSTSLLTTSPLVEVLRLVDGDKEPTMGFLYNAMDKAKEKIANNLGGEEKDYKEIWEIIDEKWEFQLYRYLHAAAYYLNPRCHYAKDFSNHPEVKLGFFYCMDRLIPDPKEREKANLQCSIFHNKEGFFGFTQTKQTFEKRSPGFQLLEETKKLKLLMDSWIDDDDVGSYN
uniref:Uncharacterized protein n=1 Tax=Cannabis sativa TaxID=3483 RepID=A0A803QF45_CANSA